MAHVPVLLKESIELLNPKEGEYFIDATLGGGGHAIEIARRIGTTGRLLAVDLDEDAIEKFKNRIQGTEYETRIVVQKGNFAHLPKIMKACAFPKAHGLIADLGFSSDQLEGGARGFSFQRREPLMMNYDKETHMKAAHIVNTYSESQLRALLRDYSGERYAGKIAKSIVRQRKKERLITTDQLVQVIAGAVPKNYEQGRIHAATRTFMALRIVVNDELRNLELMLSCVEDVVRPGGIVVIISFQSLEDRVVKNILKTKERERVVDVLVKKPITSSDEEIEKNPRARSAKLRAAQVINNH